MSESQRQVLGATRARQGRFGRHVVWVLLFGTLLAALALFGAWTWKSGDLANSTNNNGPGAGVSSAYTSPEPAPVNTQPYQKDTSQAAPPAKTVQNPQ
jgi:hypothetical protein